MKKYNLSKNITTVMLAWAMLIMPLATFGQTRISMPKNKYKVQDDVRIGREAAAQVEQQMPILNDAETTRYVQDVGRRLVNAIPSQFQQPGFQYNFSVVNARDINAFALPGGPMYVNRGMIEAARTEGEMAGVMAHELAHVALRHGTAQATKQSNPLNQILGIGAVLGGAVLGGQQGAAIGQTLYSGYILKYSREYETQADILGAQIMASAGYDPRDLANMFRTIEQQSGGSRNPEWLSSHPDPGNRYNNINREAQLLRVAGGGERNSREFQRIQSRLSGQPRAQSMEEIARNQQSGGNGQGQNPMANGRYSSRVQLPSSRSRVFSSGNFIQMNVPDNWREFPTQNSVTFAPEGAYGDQGFTHGAMIGTAQSRSNNLQQATQDYVNGLMQTEGNNYLRQNTNYTRTTLAGRNAYATTLSGRSPLTNRNEVVSIVTTQLRNGSLFYVIAVAPEDEASNYNYAFRNMIRSIRLAD
jgi:Zn-dependent protease with chaperone function